METGSFVWLGHFVFEHGFQIGEIHPFVNSFLTDFRIEIRSNHDVSNTDSTGKSNEKAANERGDRFPDSENQGEDTHSDLIKHGSRESQRKVSLILTASGYFVSRLPFVSGSIV